METKNLSTYTDPWGLVELTAEAWATQARCNGASALRIWADGNLAGYWTYSPNTATAQIQASRGRWPKATSLVFEGLSFSTESEAYWLEGTAQKVCWQAEVTGLSQLLPIQHEYDPVFDRC